MSSEAFQDVELATTWNDKRQELAKLQKARKFNQAGNLERSFRIAVEEALGRL